MFLFRMKISERIETKNNVVIISEKWDRYTISFFIFFSLQTAFEDK
jgi:hypothetical protein